MLIWIVHRNQGMGAVERGTEGMDSKKSEVLQGTLDLMILKTLHALGPLHGFGIARRIEQVSGDVLQLNEGTVCHLVSCNGGMDCGRVGLLGEQP